MQLQLFSIFLTVLSLYATQIFAYITDLKLVSCDAKHACPNYPGYRKIDINLNKGVKKGNSVYLHFKESTIDDPITDIKIEQGTNYTSAPNISKWTRLSVDLNERKDASNDASASLWLSYTKDKTVSKNPITSIIVKEGTSPLVGAEYKRIPVDLNKDVHGSYLFMYYSQDGPKDPITAITAKQCFTSNCYMEGWERVEKDLNRGIVVGMSVYLFYKRSRTDDPVTDAVVILNDQTPPEGYTKVDVNLNSIFRGDAIYLWYRTTPLTNSDVAKKAIQELAIEFGAHTMTPYGWTKINVDLNSGNNGKGTVGEPTFLYMKKGYKDLPNMKPLAFDKNGDFKILQIADLHFTNEEGVCRDVPADTECNGDMTTLKYIEKLLDHEKPDLVVFSGDNIDGAGVSDARAATFKFADPVIQRKIPWAVVFGEHDDESDLSREELIEVMRRMPYSLIQRGPMDIPGWGNYAVKVFESTQKAAPHAFTLYFLDSHSYAETKEGFDFIKSYQLDWIVKSASVFRETSNSKLNAGVFFHIPIW
ncbi:Metallo-dependent phosphatase-like protein [Mycotypha africana]|uniref:Metallo-dependent phosphatase-like protein n=1 Tax=Mycotypha africana TaxID=64632 RepID=UPI002300941B|nr:Metallo-dependent phosphatase-like protein [Mycotypha africana]KAI8977093.1 Metallo-dependent phosphatase-like protein [Mycotypha africana]